MRNDIIYLSDIFARFNELNLSFESNKVNLMTMKFALSGFNSKLVMYWQNLARREFFQFSNLQQLNISNMGIFNVDVDRHNKHSGVTQRHGSLMPGCLSIENFRLDNSHTIQ